MGLIGCADPAIPRTPKPLKNKPSPAVNVVVFTATWCGPCRRQHPELIVLKAKGLRAHEFDIDAYPAMKARFKINTVPTYVVRVGREEKWRTNDVNDLWKLLKE